MLLYSFAQYVWICVYTTVYCCCCCVKSTTSMPGCSSDNGDGSEWISVAHFHTCGYVHEASMETIVGHFTMKLFYSMLMSIAIFFPCYTLTQSFSFAFFFLLTIHSFIHSFVLLLSTLSSISRFSFFFSSFLFYIVLRQQFLPIRKKKKKETSGLTCVKITFPYTAINTIVIISINSITNLHSFKFQKKFGEMVKKKRFC